MNIIFTIVAKNYLASAITLEESLRRSNPEPRFYIVVVDKLTKEVEEIKEHSNIISSEELGITNFKEMAFKYDIVEFSTAIKPFFFRYAIENIKADKVIYLDPDIFVYNTLHSVWDNLESNSVILTPHIVDGCNRVEYNSQDRLFLKYGIYNLGFVGIKGDIEGKKIIDWWCSRLEEDCYMNDVCFVDQKWMDYIPALFKSVYIERGKEYNLAWWNFSERILYSDKDNIYVDCDGDKIPVIFIHFSNYKPGMNISYIERKGTHIGEKQENILKDLYENYGDTLKKNNYSFYCKMPYDFNFYNNGRKIERINRRIFSKLKGSMYIEDPFVTDAKSFYSFMESNKLLSNEFGCTEGRLEESRRGENFTQSKKVKLLNRLLIILKNIAGVKKYQNFIEWFVKNYSIDNQIFLLKKKDR